MFCIKNRSKNQAPRIYVPEEEVQMRKYYERIAKERPHLGLIVETLPKSWDAGWVRDQNEKPGILALAMKERKREGQDSDFEGIPFVVPGARFNEVRNFGFLLLFEFGIDERLFGLQLYNVRYAITPELGAITDI